jgi:ADP-ribosylglycohydrolase
MTNKSTNNLYDRSVSSVTPGLVAKSVGALQALAAGDALGWPQEMRGQGRHAGGRPTVVLHDWIRRAGGRFHAHEETIRAGEYSDDTQLSFAVARSLLSTGEWADCLAQRELPFFQLYQRGAGRATLRAVASWQRGIPPWAATSEVDIRGYLDAGANGAAMRCLPHALWHAAEGRIEDLITDVHADSVLTHGHPRALLGAALYATAAYWLLRLRKTLTYGALIRELLEIVPLWGAMPTKLLGWRDAHKQFTGRIERVWEETVQEIVHLLNIASNGLERGALADDQDMLGRLGCLGKWKGSGTATSVGAIYLASRHAALPTAGVLAAAFADDADTDTLAAMTGGLLGALASSEWMPSEWLQVQDLEALAAIAERVVSHRCDDAPWRALSGADVQCVADAAEKNGGFEIDGYLRGKVIEREELYSQEKLAAVTLRTILHDRQTIYLKRLVSKSARVDTGAVGVAVRTGATHSGIDYDRSPRKQRVPSESSDRLVRKRKRSDIAEVHFRSIRMAVTNLEASRSFYSAIGLRVMSSDVHEASFGSFSISTFPADSEISAKSGLGGRTVLMLDAPDLELATARVLRAGGTEVGRSSESAEVQWVRFRDLDGNFFEIHER